MVTPLHWFTPHPAPKILLELIRFFVLGTGTIIEQLFYFLYVEYVPSVCFLLLVNAICRSVFCSVCCLVCMNILIEVREGRKAKEGGVQCSDSSNPKQRLQGSWRLSCV